jgi:hypothetical protein
VRKGVADFADDFGYDLDEEGHPLEDRDDPTREEEGIRSRRDEGSEGDGDLSGAPGTQGEGGEGTGESGDLSGAPGTRGQGDGDDGQSDETEEAGAVRAS